MKDFIEKLIGRLDKQSAYSCSHCMEDAIEIVRELAEEYNNGWIPCSERLPEDEKYYLVAMVTEEIRIFKYKPSEKRWQDMTGCIEYGIIAWQPLPNPFYTKE